MAIDMWRTRPYSTGWTTPIRRMVDPWFEQAFAPIYSSAAGANAGYDRVPVAECQHLWETNDTYLRALLAPGIDEQSINVAVHDDTLAVEASLSCRRQRERKGCPRSSRRSSSAVRCGSTSRWTQTRWKPRSRMVC
jgi:HSP20 family molecular chaperone IbpA